RWSSRNSRSSRRPSASTAPRIPRGQGCPVRLRECSDAVAIYAARDARELPGRSSGSTRASFTGLSYTGHGPAVKSDSHSTSIKDSHCTNVNDSLPWLDLAEHAEIAEEPGTRGVGRACGGALARGSAHHAGRQAGAPQARPEPCGFRSAP